MLHSYSTYISYFLSYKQVFYLHVSLVSSIAFCSSLLLRTAPMLSGLSAPSCKNKTLALHNRITRSSLVLFFAMLANKHWKVLHLLCKKLPPELLSFTYFLQPAVHVDNMLQGNSFFIQILGENNSASIIHWKPQREVPSRRFDIIMLLDACHDVGSC